MRKFGITTFALFYAVLIFSATAERSNAWAVREAEVLAHSSSSSHFPALGKPFSPDAYLSQKKRVESEFVIEMPRESVFIQNHAGRYKLLSSAEFPVTPDERPSLSRSPPSRS